MKMVDVAEEDDTYEACVPHQSKVAAGEEHTFLFDITLDRTIRREMARWWLSTYCDVV